jgi:SagB-type dehydrogenase family enzyme
MLLAVNKAAMVDSTSSFQTIWEQPGFPRYVEPAIKLPTVVPFSYDFAEACKNRFSPETDFVLGKVNHQLLANLLQEATASYTYRNDLADAFSSNEPRVSIFGCFYHVEGVPNGAYFYDSVNHELLGMNPGDHRLHLQSGLSLDNVNLLQIPICLHVAGNKDYYKDTFGYRGYRIMQMEAGMLVQQLLIASTALGMGGHPLLGFDTNLSDEIYKMDSKAQTSLIQIPIGFHRQRPWLKGSLQS